MKRLVILISAMLAGAAAFSDDTGGTNSNFQFSPPPCPYPFFTPGRTDNKATGTYASMKMGDLKIQGGGIDLLVRPVSRRDYAYSIQVGYMMMQSGDFPSMGGGAAGKAGGDNFMTWDNGKWDLQMNNILGSLVGEYQAVHDPSIDVILLVGPNFTLGWGEMTPDYTKTGVLIWDTNGDGKFSKPTSAAKLKGIELSSYTVGAKAGIQLGVPLGPLELAPFAVLGSMLSGRGTFKMNSGYEEIPSASSSADLPRSNNLSLGLDIIVTPWGLSLGSVFQQVMAKKKADNADIILVTAGWHWVTHKPAGTAATEGNDENGGGAEKAGAAGRKSR